MQKTTEDAAPPNYPIESVNRALRLVWMFRDRSEIRLADARDYLGVGQSTAHRLMAMLVYHGFAVQDPIARTYKAGPALVEVGLAVVGRMDLRTVARPILEDLAAETGETVHLGVLEGGDVRFVDVIESELALRVAGRVGRLLPAYATSLGKSMLAQLTTERVRTLYPQESLAPVTSNTLTRRSALLEELEHARERGYAVNTEESEDGVASVGVAVIHPTRGPVAAVTVAAPITRMSEGKRERIAAMMTERCQHLADSIG